MDESLLIMNMDGLSTLSPPFYGGDAIDLLTHVLSFHVPIVVLCFGYIGNTLALATMTFTKRSIASFHFRTLAVADIFTSASMINQIILTSAPELVIPWGNIFCADHWFIGYFTWGFSYWCLVTLTLDRVVAVCFPMKAAVWCTMKRARALVCVNVVGHCVLYAMNLWREFHPPDPQNISHFSMCQVPRTLPSWFPIFEEAKYQFFDVYLPPLTVLIGNICIIMTLEENRKISLHKTKETHENSMTVMLISVSITFVVLALPYPVDYLYWELLNRGHGTPRWRGLSYVATNVLAQVNSSINFYIYLLSSSQFRKDFMRLFHRWFRRGMPN